MRGQVFPKDWTMPREFQIRHLISLSLYVDGGFLNGHSFPPVFCLVTKGIRGIERLNIQILLIHAEDGPAEAPLARYVRPPLQAIPLPWHQLHSNLEKPGARCSGATERCPRCGADRWRVSACRFVSASRKRPSYYCPTLHCPIQRGSHTQSLFWEGSSLQHRGLTDCGPNWMKDRKDPEPERDPVRLPG